MAVGSKGEPMEHAATPASERSLVISYLTLRRAIGILGVLLPLVLSLGKILLQGRGLDCSISDYYYTVMGNVFVGSLCSIGVFLMSYRGYDRRDEVAGRLACVFAVCVALFPTARCGASSTPRSYFHWTCAALLFLLLAYFCLVLFTETHPQSAPTRKKRQRNFVYKTCGYAILGSMLLIGADKWIPSIQKLLDPFNPIFWLESLAVVSFGAAWLIKGETILKDEKPAVRRLD
jgi:hypothetical protein